VVLISFISLGSGVALFMFGMLLVKYSLEKNYGDKMKDILSKFTGNRFLSTLTGAFVTFALQSSSASSVLTAAFVDSGYLTLYKAFWIIVGANAGTTFTGLLTAVDFSNYTGILLVIGIIIISVCKKQRNINKGVLLSGLGMMFTGLTFMGNAVNGVKEHKIFISILSSCSSPVTGILSGALVTAVIQSSSAVTAVLQSLAGEGLIGIRQAFYMILGANIGTCATCAIASMGLSGGAKKVSLMHIMYNLSGSVLFVFLSSFIPVPEIVEGFCGNNMKLSIALINIIFNVCTAVAALSLPIKEKTEPGAYKKKSKSCLQVNLHVIE